MSKQVLVIEFSNGECWEFDPTPIAEARADYYATEVDGHAKGSNEWTDEVQYALGDEDSLIDYAQNNMNWSDLVKFGRKQNGPAPLNYQAELGEADWRLEASVTPNE